MHKYSPYLKWLHSAELQLADGGTGIDGEVEITWVQLLLSGDCCLKSPVSGAPDSGSSVLTAK